METNVSCESLDVTYKLTAMASMMRIPSERAPDMLATVLPTAGSS